MQNLADIAQVRTCREPQKDGCHEDGFIQPRINLVGSSIKNMAI